VQALAAMQASTTAGRQMNRLQGMAHLLHCHYSSG